MKRELNLEEQKTVSEIINALGGYNVEQAETILKEVASELKERAIIEAGGK